jgi:hypothetical protein
MRYKGAARFLELMDALDSEARKFGYGVAVYDQPSMISPYGDSLEVRFDPIKVPAAEAGEEDK